MGWWSHAEVVVLLLSTAEVAVCEEGNADGQLYSSSTCDDAKKMLLPTVLSTQRSEW